MSKRRVCKTGLSSGVRMFNVIGKDDLLLYELRFSKQGAGAREGSLWVCETSGEITCYEDRNPGRTSDQARGNEGHYEVLLCGSHELRVPAGLATPTSLSANPAFSLHPQKAR